MKAFKGLREKISKGEGGFTLIELLIVIIILGILAAVVAFNVSGFLGQGTREVAKTQQATLETALMASMADYSSTTVTPSPTPIGADGDADTDPSTITLTMSDGSQPLLSKYIRSDIHGSWTVDTATGMITVAAYNGGGTECNYTAAAGWGCT